MLVSQIEHNEFHGRVSRGKVERGTVRVGEKLSIYDQDGELKETGEIKKIFKNIGLEYVSCPCAMAH